jgi:hypothetical protein
MTMIKQSIISDDQALQILKNDLRKRALEQRATEVNNATPEWRAEILAFYGTRIFHY